MKSLIILLLLIPVFSQAQNAYNKIEIYHPKFCYLDSSNTYERAFENKILELMPSYQLTKRDTIDRRWYRPSEITYKSSYKNSDMDSLELSITVRFVEGDRNLKIKPKPIIYNVYVLGQFLTMRQFFNDYFSKDLSIDDLKKLGSFAHIGGHLIDNTNRYWQNFGFKQNGYWYLDLMVR
ncbi:MAG: hypothetical protein EPN37_04430 [Chitinophagaceae bacterium]|nr:MAG: hypothetical protein EPN37_04430 [Chitinophagaceae bacterium]